MNSGSQDMPMNMPPMNMPQDMGNDMGGNFMPQDNMGGMPMDNGMMNDMPNQFDTNFDAGVEADEEQDPKKFIQQLTGKLSQSLRKYNEESGQPDTDLNKYVAGMIVKQATEGLSQEDADEIIDKIKSDEDFNQNDEPQMQDMEMQQNGMQPQQGNQMGDNMQQMNENYQKRKSRKKIDEIVNGVLDNMKRKEISTHTSSDKKSFLKEPFMSPFN